MSISNAHHGDNIAWMKQFPDKFFDLCMADPEYGIGASRPTKKSTKCKQKNGSYLEIKAANYSPKDWDMKPANEDYFNELFRVSKHQIIWGVNYFNYNFGSGRLVWDKLNGGSDQMDCEIAYCSFNNRTDLVYYMWHGMMQGVYCGKDIKQALVQQGNKELNEQRIHPTQKPVKLYDYILQNYASPGFKILDPNMGSESSRIAAYKGGYDYWGAELDEDYYRMGNERFEMFRRDEEDIKAYGYAKSKLSEENPVLF